MNKSARKSPRWNSAVSRDPFQFLNTHSVSRAGVAVLTSKAGFHPAGRDVPKLVGSVVIGLFLLCPSVLQAKATTPTTFYAPFDFDGDGVTDKAVFDPATSTWYLVPSSGSAPSPWTCFEGSCSYQFGAFEDIPVPGDYNAR